MSNKEGYTDLTADIAIYRVMKKQKCKKQGDRVLDQSNTFSPKAVTKASQGSNERK